MPIKKSAVKALRKSKRNRERNLKSLNVVKSLVKEARKHAAANNKDKAAETAKKAIKAIDKAVQNKILKKNTGARKKSRLLKAIR